MTVNARVRDILDNLEAHEGYYVAKWGAKYMDVYSRLWELLEPDACSEHRGGCPKGAH